MKEPKLDHKRLKKFYSATFILKKVQHEKELLKIYINQQEMATQTVTLLISQILRSKTNGSEKANYLINQNS